MKIEKSFGKRFNKFMRSELMAKIMLVIFILAILLICLETIGSNKEDIHSCKSDCEKYNMTFLKFNGDCFCTDTDGKPRLIPVGVIS